MWNYYKSEQSLLQNLLDSSGNPEDFQLLKKNKDGKYEAFVNVAGYDKSEITATIEEFRGNSNITIVADNNEFGFKKIKLKIYMDNIAYEDINLTLKNGILYIKVNAKKQKDKTTKTLQIK